MEAETALIVIGIILMIIGVLGLKFIDIVKHDFLWFSCNTLFAIGLYLVVFLTLGMFVIEKLT